MPILQALVSILAVGYALHSDEVGQRDWHVPLVGHVERAVVSDGTTFVAGTRGFVAAVNEKGSLRWRLPVSQKLGDGVLSMLPPTRRVRHLTVITKRRMAYAIDALTGEAIATATLGTLGNARSLVGCNTDDTTTLTCLEREGKQAFRVTYDTARMEASDDDFSNIEKTALIELPGDDGVKDAALYRQYAWLVTEGASLVRVDMRNGSTTAVAAGVQTVVSCTPTMAIFKSAESLRSVVVKARGNEVGELAASNHAVALGEGAAVSVKPPGGNGAPILSLTTSGGTVDYDLSMPEIYHRQLALVAARMDSNDALTVVLRAYNDDLIAARIDINNGRTADVMWERLEGLASPAQAAFADDMEDQFGFRRSLYIVSVFGTVYARHVSGDAFKVVGCFSTVSPVNSQYAQLSAHGGVVSITAKSATQTSRLSLRPNGSPTVEWRARDPLVALPDGAVERDLSLVGPSPATGYFTWYANTTSGAVNGVLVGQRGTVQPRWSLRLNAPIALMATLGRDGEHESSVNLRHVRNATGVGHIYHKYRTKHLLVMGQYVHNALQLTAVDVITGSVVAAQEVIGVAPGSASMVVSEHAVVVPYTAAADARPYVLTWELFETEERITTDGMTATPAGVIASLVASWRERAPSSAYTTRAPTVVATRRPLFLGQVTSVGVTSSLFGAARRLVIFATARGQVYAIELSSLLVDSAGVPNPLNPDDPPIDAVGAPATSIVSHLYDVVGIDQIITSPTKLESSSHVAAVGFDVFYSRVAAGKPFDTLNTDFNASLVWGITGGCVALAVVLRFFAHQKRVKSAWA